MILGQYYAGWCSGGEADRAPAGIILTEDLGEANTRLEDLEIWCSLIRLLKLEERPQVLREILDDRIL